MLSRILGWLREDINDPALELTPQTDLISSNLVDSMGLLRMVTFIEDSFGITMDPESLVPENFETPERIAALVRRTTA